MPSDSPDSLAVWRRIAGWWDRQIGSGNDFQLELIMPATDRLLQLRPGERVLDACCGNGNYSRRLARAGAAVVAFDGAEDFLAAARARTTPQDGSIDYRLLDATDETALNSLDRASFDAVVCSMAMMDLPTISPLLRASRQLLRPGGRFVFSVSHPCFNSNEPTMTAELRDQQGQLSQVFGVRIDRYLTPTCDRSCGIINQPELHWMYHRPLSVLLRECFAAGYVLDAMEEPAFALRSGTSAFSWAKRPEIPPALVCRIKPV